jgi:hypothetical protein
LGYKEVIGLQEISQMCDWTSGDGQWAGKDA